MKYWLFKSEPGSWSWEDQLAKGAEGEGWDGVRNHQASNNMKAMKVKDKGFFYHSVSEKRIVGLVEVIKEYHPDSTDLTNRFGMVSIKALCSINKPITLYDIKSEKRLSDFALIKQSRLSVVPVSNIHWKILCEMGNISQKF